jgi:hypothetical protein
VSNELEAWLKERPPENLLIVLSEGTIVWDDFNDDFDWNATTAVPKTLADVLWEAPIWSDLKRTVVLCSSGEAEYFLSRDGELLLQRFERKAGVGELANDAPTEGLLVSPDNLFAKLSRNDQAAARRVLTQLVRLTESDPPTPSARLAVGSKEFALSEKRALLLSMMSPWTP